MKSLPAILFLILLWSINAVPVFPQNTTLLTDSLSVEENGQESDKIAVKPISSANIPSEATRTSQKLRTIRSMIETQDLTERLYSELPDLRQDLDNLMSRSEMSRLVTLNTRRLSELEKAFQRQKSDFEGNEEELATRIRQLTESKKEIDRDLRRWLLTQNSVTSDPVAHSLRNRITTTIEAIRNTKNDLDERLSELLDYQDQITRQLIVINDQTNIIRDLLRERQLRLFKINSPKIWDDFAQQQEETVSVGETIDRSFLNHVGYLQNFYGRYEKNIFIHLLILIVVMIAAVNLSKKVSEVEELLPEKFEDYGRILKRPVPAALVPVLLLSFYIYPDAPMVVSGIALLLIIIPSFMLLNPVLPRMFRIAFYILVGLQFLAGIYELLVHSIYTRIFLVLLTLGAGLVFFLFVLRLKDFSTEDSPRWRSVFLATGRVGYILAGLALAGNLLGFEALSEYVTIGIINGAFFGVLLYGASLVINGMITLFVYGQAGRKLKLIQMHRDEVHRKVTRFIKVVTVILWLDVTFILFNIEGDVLNYIGNILGTTWNIGSASISVGDILSFILILYVSILISRFIRFLFEVEVRDRMQLEAGVAGTISILIRYAILAFGFFFALTAAGFGFDRLALLVGALGIGIGFGLQSIFNNLISGLILAFERPVKVGDVIEIKTLDLIGNVTEIGIRASNIRTFDGMDVIVPNGNIVSNEIVNWTLSDQHLRNTIQVGVAYGTDPQKVIDILVDVARSNENVMQDPEPFALFQEFGESSLNFTLYFWTKSLEGRLLIISEITVAVNTALKEAGITIPFPQRDLHLKSIEEDAGKKLGKGE